MGPNCIPTLDWFPLPVHHTEVCDDQAPLPNPPPLDLDQELVRRFIRHEPDWTFLPDTPPGAIGVLYAADGLHLPLLVQGGDQVPFLSATVILASAVPPAEHERVVGCLNELNQALVVGHLELNRQHGLLAYRATLGRDIVGDLLSLTNELIASLLYGTVDAVEYVGPLVSEVLARPVTAAQVPALLEEVDGVGLALDDLEDEVPAANDEEERDAPPPTRLPRRDR